MNAFFIASLGAQKIVLSITASNVIDKNGNKEPSDLISIKLENFDFSRRGPYHLNDSRNYLSIQIGQSTLSYKSGEGSLSCMFVVSKDGDLYRGSISCPHLVKNGNESITLSGDFVIPEFKK